MRIRERIYDFRIWLADKILPSDCFVREPTIFALDDFAERILEPAVLNLAASIQQEGKEAVMASIARQMEDINIRQRNEELLRRLDRMGSKDIH